MDGIGEGVTQTASRNEIAIQALNDVKENVFITTVARDLDNISDFDGAVQLTTEALKEASRRYDRQILITTAWEGLFKTSFFFLVALAVIIAIGQMSNPDRCLSNPYDFINTVNCGILFSIAQSCTYRGRYQTRN